MTLRTSTAGGAGRRGASRAAGLFAFLAVAGSLVRLSRGDFGLLPALAPLDFHGTSTNFAACAGAPFIAFWLGRPVRFADLVRTAVGTAVGLSAYELAQLYLPRRTFDPHDFTAAFLGAACSIALGGRFHFPFPPGRPRQNTAPGAGGGAEGGGESR